MEHTLPTHWICHTPQHNLWSQLVVGRGDFPIKAISCFNPPPPPSLMDKVVVIKNMVAVESDGWIKTCMWTILLEKWYGTKQSIKSKTCMQSTLCNNKPAKQTIYFIIIFIIFHLCSSMFILFAPTFDIFATLETPTLLAAVRSSASSVRFTGELPSVETSSGSSAPPLGTGDDSGGVGTCLMLGSGLSLLMTILGWLRHGLCCSIPIRPFHII